MIFDILVAAFVIMIASFAGIIFAWKNLKDFFSKNSPYLATFAGGVFIVVVYTLLQEMFHLEDSLWIIFGSLLFGMLFLEVASRLLPDGHHHHDAPVHHHSHSKIDAKRMLLGDSIHNIGDGLILVPAFLADIRLGIAAALGIFLHELVQEISEFFVLKEAGYSTRQALTLNFLVSSTILIGVFIALFFSSSEAFIAPLIGFAAGGFLYVIIRDIFPHTLDSIKHKCCPKRHLLALIFGICIMALVAYLTPHSHEFEDSHTHDHDHNDAELHTPKHTDSENTGHAVPTNTPKIHDGGEEDFHKDDERKESENHTDHKH